jgi:hypothetical protein
LRNHVPTQGLVLVLTGESGLISRTLGCVCKCSVRVGDGGLELVLASKLGLTERFRARVADLTGVLRLTTLSKDDFRVLTNLASERLEGCFQIDFTHS